MTIKNTVSRVLGWNAVSQLIMILTTPLLARIYDVSVFGELATVNAILLTVGVVGCFRYDQLIFQFKNEKEINSCINNAFFCSVVIFLFSIIMAWTIYFYILDVSIYLVFIIPVMIWLFTISNLLSSILSINAKYEKITRSTVVRAVSIFVFQYVCHYLFGSKGLVLGLLLGQVCQFFYLSIYSFKWISINRKCFSLFQAKNALMSSLQSLFNSASSQIPSFFIPFKYGMELMGAYSMALRLTYIPINFITNALRPVILGEFNSKKNDFNGIYKDLYLGSLGLVMIASIGILLINVFSKEFFEFYIGPSWRSSGEIASILSFWIMLGFSNILAVSYLTVYSRFKFLLCYDGLLLTFRFGSVFLSVYCNLSFLEFVKIYSLLGFIFNAFIILFSIWLAKNEKNTNCYSG